MDIFKFINPESPTKMEEAEIINGLTSKMWIERYLKEGEFTLTAPVSSGVKEKLPIGSFISHVNTTEIMVVENHEINDDKDKESTIKITGRGFETVFENRIVGSNRALPSSEPIVDYILPANFTWNQAVSLIDDHILPVALIDDTNAVPYVQAFTSVSGSSVSIERTTKRGPLYEVLLSLLSIDNLGIKVVRPGPWSPLGATSPDVAVIIHTGTDRSQDVIFSYDIGEIVSADYLWSNKKSKNAILVTGKWVEVLVVDPEKTEYDRRITYISASDIDDMYTELPNESQVEAIILQMNQRGLEALASLKEVAITKAEVSREVIKSKYRVDFDVGDLIRVVGGYNANAIMRVSEYVEIEDSTGESGYPTLSFD